MTKDENAPSDIPECYLLSIPATWATPHTDDVRIACDKCGTMMKVRPHSLEKLKGFITTPICIYCMAKRLEQEPLTSQERALKAAIAKMLSQHRRVS